MQAEKYFNPPARNGQSYSKASQKAFCPPVEDNRIKTELFNRWSLSASQAIGALVDFRSSIHRWAAAGDITNAEFMGEVQKLADTRLRVSEACGLCRGDFDWQRQQAVVIGKGDKQAIVRFSQQALQYIKAYLQARFELDRKQGRPDMLPVFARHDKKTGQQMLPISKRTAEHIVVRRVVEALGEGAQGTLTPHSFRHYFVTGAVRASDIVSAGSLARHSNVNTTLRYTHLTKGEIDKIYTDIFNKPTKGRRRKS